MGRHCLEEIVYIQEFAYMSEKIKMDKCSSSRKWGVTRFQQVWLNVNM